MKQTVIYGTKNTCPLSYFDASGSAGCFTKIFHAKNCRVNLCYTLRMSENQQNWMVWSRTLHRWGVENGVASLLEIAGSLSVLLAQILYISQPVLSGAVSSRSLQAVAQVLEDPEDRRQFIALLREASTRGTRA
jgi:hypothetical protein